MCYACDNTKCSTCDGSATNCLLECNNTCLTCNIKSECLTCIDGNYLLSGLCLACDNTKCATCNSDGCIKFCNDDCFSCDTMGFCMNYFLIRILIWI